ncbi:tetratricopeptide repeat protein [Parasphingorhabdus sp.]|uniref:tetratricopeptide repeat protein n=1 Tax=Parasphingorhabdus sp. TaxID=2709688 RepID=UPI003002A9B7
MSSPKSEEQRIHLLRTETQAILQAPEFIRSPVMTQLLRYLVEEAIANPGNPPKAYQVAVDGLGRPEDFDVQADSYPRVQVGRLRKMLSAYYAARGRAERLHIPIGHYAVEIERDDAEAVPIGEDAAAVHPEAAVASANQDLRPSRLDRWKKALALTALLLLTGIGLFWVMNSVTPSLSEVNADPDRYILPPKVYIATKQQSGADTGEKTSAEIERFFEDAFARSSQVRLAAASEANINAGNGENSYLFQSKIVDGPSGPEINISVVSLLRDETIWSTTIPVPESAADYHEQLGLVASRIASIYGVIATDQRKHLPKNAMVGHACLLRFESFRANRDPALLPVVESCIRKSLAADPLDSRILAAGSYLSFLREEVTGHQPDPVVGMEYARRAMVRGREDAAANFSLARSSFLTGNCNRGKEFAQKAAELNPYEATIQAQIGAHLFACGDREAIVFLKRAMALDPRGSILAETGLVFTLLAEGKNREALELAEKIVPSSTSAGPYYDIAMTMVYAKNGRVEDSRASWDRLVAAYGKKDSESPQQFIGRLIINPLLAQRAYTLLSQSGVVK